MCWIAVGEAKKASVYKRKATSSHHIIFSSATSPIAFTAIAQILPMFPRVLCYCSLAFHYSPLRCPMFSTCLSLASWLSYSMYCSWSEAIYMVTELSAIQGLDGFYSVGWRPPKCNLIVLHFSNSPANYVKLSTRLKFILRLTDAQVVDYT